MRNVAVFFALVFMAGCETGEPTPTNADLCTSYGFEFGTDAYGQCMLRLAELELQRRQMTIDYWQNRRREPIPASPTARLGLPPVGWPSQTICQQIGTTVYCDTY